MELTLQSQIIQTQKRFGLFLCNQSIILLINLVILSNLLINIFLSEFDQNTILYTTSPTCTEEKNQRKKKKLCKFQYIRSTLDFIAVISIKNQRLRRGGGRRRRHREPKERKRTLLEQRQQLRHQPRHLKNTSTDNNQRRRRWKSMFPTWNQGAVPVGSRGGRVPIGRHNAAAATRLFKIKRGPSSSDSRRKLRSNVQWNGRTTTNCSSWVLAMEFRSKFPFSLMGSLYYTVFFFFFFL